MPDVSPAQRERAALKRKREAKPGTASGGPAAAAAAAGNGSKLAAGPLAGPLGAVATKAARAAAKAASQAAVAVSPTSEPALHGAPRLKKARRGAAAAAAAAAPPAGTGAELTHSAGAAGLPGPVLRTHLVPIRISRLAGLAAVAANFQRLFMIASSTDSAGGCWKHLIATPREFLVWDCYLGCIFALFSDVEAERPVLTAGRKAKRKQLAAEAAAAAAAQAPAQKAKKAKISTQARLQASSIQPEVIAQPSSCYVM